MQVKTNMNNELMGGAPQTPVLKPVVQGDGKNGETLDTEHNQATGKQCIVGKEYDY